MYFYTITHYPIRTTAFLIFLFLFCACRKDTFSTDPALRLTASADTIHFDTVFTTAGSTTQGFKIFNNHNEGIRINSVRLAGGNASAFRINADGTPGPEINNLEIRANDSAYVFVTVRINPTAADLPFVVSDSIEVNYNSNKLKVQLQAYGQNAHFIKNKIISGNETWQGNLPYVILGGVLVDAGAQLIINKGCRIYAHADAPVIIDGTLKVMGEKWDSTRVVFSGDRLDAPYRDFPASWPGIIFTANSKDNVINYAVIKNAYQALVLQEPALPAAPVLTLTQSIIENAYDAGILAVNSGITAQNVLIANCGKNLMLVKGGTYNFTHCTVASFSNSYLQHKEPVLLLSNFISQNNVIAARSLNAVFRNCIFWGESGGLVKEEVVASKNEGTGFQVTFDVVLWPMQRAPAQVTVNNAITEPPLFDSVDVSKRIFNFHLKENSPAINKGTVTSLTLDIMGNPRPVGLPDLGAYEKQ